MVWSKAFFLLFALNLIDCLVVNREQIEVDFVGNNIFKHVKYVIQN